MSQIEQPDQEPSTSDASATVEQAKSQSRRRSFANARRELSDDELASPAVQKLLIDEIERLEVETGELAAVRAQFHSADKRASILQEKHKRVIAHEVISNACLAVGAAALGYIPSLSASAISMLFCAAFGVILLGAGIWAKVLTL